MIRLEGLTKRYPGQREDAVEALDMEIPDGEIVVLVGPSGCGKTTTMRLINRLTWRGRTLRAPTPTNSAGGSAT
jgi:osmoprotectant transport system ATP-binding protein